MVHSANSMNYPWLCVDLGKEALVYSVGIFNRYNGNMLIHYHDRNLKFQYDKTLCFFSCIFGQLRNVCLFPQI